jgi:hypothetical protein
MKTGFGAKAISMRWYFAATPFGFLSASPLKNVALCDKEIAKTHFVRKFPP